MAISAIVLTRNEEANIAQCLEGLAFCDEIVVVDDFSTDKTLEIIQNLIHSTSSGLIQSGVEVLKLKNQNYLAKPDPALQDKSKIKTFQRDLDGDFAAQRNFGLTKAKGDWVLIVDADERVSDALKDEIIRVTKDLSQDMAGFYLRRKDVLWGKALNHGETGSVKLLRLARRGTGKWFRSVHETWRIKGPTGTLKNDIYHFPHQSLNEFLDHINYFSTLHAKANLKEGKHANLAKTMFWPKAKFIQNYFLKLGFLDGTRGFVVALLMSLHSFLSWGKLWTKETK